MQFNKICVRMYAENEKEWMENGNVKKAIINLFVCYFVCCIYYVSCVCIDIDVLWFWKHIQ